MKTNIVIVTYNRIKLLKECIQNINSNTDFVSKVYIINNNSDDGTKEYLDSISGSFYKPVNLEKNIGGAGGFAYGLKYAFENSDDDYFLLMDDDTMIQTNTLKAFSLAIEKLNGNFGFLSSNVRWYGDGKPSYLNTPVVEKNWTELSEEGLTSLISASFVSFLVSRKVIQKVGLPIKEMFIWADDVEYSTRISKYYPSYFVADSVVIHKCKNNDYGDNIVMCDERRIFYYECMFRNRMYIYRKYYGKKLTLLHFVNYLFTIFPVIFKSKNKRLKRVKALICGSFKGLFFNPEIEFPSKKGSK
ncbi:MAG: glycosyltransferase family 2 protein [Staphylococcus epidermidis]|nr:glycosyltransferase family 2 protein [Staphylococcus epidermidis]